MMAMETEDRRGWRQQLRDALRPEAKPAPLSRRAVRADVVLAIVLTVVALVWVARYPDSGPVQIDRDAPFRPPPPPTPPGVLVPEEETSSLTGLWPLVVLSALPLAARRRYPLAAFAVVMAATLAMVDDASWISVLTCVIGAIQCRRPQPLPDVGHGRTGHRRRAGGPRVPGHGARRCPGWSSPAVVLLIAGVLAGLVRIWKRQLAASRDRYARLQQAQEEATRRAVEEERARIAAELHDVVTHNVSVMVIQAGAARKVMDAAPERSKEALLAVEAGGRAAMAELRHVMGLLAGPDTGRPDTPADGLEPQPGLGQLDALTERVRAAGTPVGVAVSLPPDPLPPGVDLAAYRVVQEALTNTIKHAPGAEASVMIGYTDDSLEIEVTDNGGAHDSPPADGNGRGLIGLRERLAVYGGELTAGPTLTGGYRIKARVPGGSREPAAAARGHRRRPGPGAYGIRDDPRR